MVYLKWAFRIVFWGTIIAVFHYTLPQHDVVRVADTYEKRIDFGENSIFWANQGTGEAEGTVNRDVFFIQTFKANNRPMIYRNEDTGWGWPPYFKFDTSNLQAEANNLRSTKDDPQWVVVKHYGWRNEFMSIYPNAISLRPVESPDVRIIPWLNIVIIALFLALFRAIWVRWNRFRKSRIDPVVEDIGDGFDAAGDGLSNAGSRLGGLFGRKRK